MRRTALFLALLLVISCFPLAGQGAEIYQAPKQIVVTFTGDCTLGCTPLERELPTGFETFIEKYGVEYPFAQVRDIFLADDLTVVNLEGVFYDYEANRANKTYT